MTSTILRRQLLCVLMLHDMMMVKILRSHHYRVRHVQQPAQKNTDLWLILVFCYIVHCIVIVVIQFGLKRDVVKSSQLLLSQSDYANDSLKIFWFCKE